MPTATVLIQTAFHKLGVLAGGESADGTMASDALADLGRVLERYTLDGALIYATQVVNTAVIGGVATYTLGPNGTINLSQRPLRIRDGYTRVGTVDYPFCVITEAEYTALVLKSTTASLAPTSVWYNPTLPLGVATFWPVPTVGTFFLPLDIVWSAPTSLGTVLTLPPGYEELLIYDLAARLAPEYGVSFGLTLQAERHEAKKYAMRANRQPQYMGIDPFLVHGRGADATWIQHGGFL